MGRESGLTDDKLAALADFETNPHLDELERLVIRYAVEMTRTPVHLPDELFEALRARLSERQMVELTSAIAWENYRARFDHALGIESEGFSEGAYCPLPEPQRGTGE